MATMVKSSEAMAGPDLCSGTCLCGVTILYKQFYCQLTAKKKKIEIKVPNPHCIKRLLQIFHISIELIKWVRMWTDSILIFKLCLLHICAQATELILLIPNHNNRINVMTVTKPSCQERQRDKKPLDCAVLYQGIILYLI